MQRAWKKIKCVGKLEDAMGTVGKACQWAEKIVIGGNSMGKQDATFKEHGRINGFVAAVQCASPMMCEGHIGVENGKNGAGYVRDVGSELILEVLWWKSPASNPHCGADLRPLCE